MTDHSKRLLSRVGEPAEEPVTLTEAKLYLRITPNTEDSLISMCIAAARQQAEEYLRRSLVTQSWKLAMDDFLPEETLLPRGPVTAITSVTMFDRAGASTLVSAVSYYMDAAKDALIFEACVESTRVEIIYTAGYGTAASVPPPLKLGMLAHIAALYEHRGDAELRIPNETIALYAPFREVRL